jgi:hypothetical protein
MTNDNKENLPGSDTRKAKVPQDWPDEAKRGKEAIEAGKSIDPRPAVEKDEEERRDAERWRNEG